MDCDNLMGIKDCLKVREAIAEEYKIRSPHPSSLSSLHCRMLGFPLAQCCRYSTIWRTRISLAPRLLAGLNSSRCEGNDLDMPHKCPARLEPPPSCSVHSTCLLGLPLLPRLSFSVHSIHLARQGHTVPLGNRWCPHLTRWIQSLETQHHTVQPQRVHTLDGGRQHLL